MHIHPPLVHIYFYMHLCSADSCLCSRSFWFLRLHLCDLYKTSHYRCMHIHPPLVCDLNETSHYQEVVIRISTILRAATRIVTQYMADVHQKVSQSQQIFAVVTGSPTVEQCGDTVTGSFGMVTPFAALSTVHIAVTTPWLYMYACTSTSGTCTFVHVP